MDAVGSAMKFQSTPSVRRATKKLGRAIVRQFISIHALREEDDLYPVACRSRKAIFQSTPSARRTTPGVEQVAPLGAISIHALREEDDR